MLIIIAVMISRTAMFPRSGIRAARQGRTKQWEMVKALSDVKSIHGFKILYMDTVSGSGFTGLRL